MEGSPSSKGGTRVYGVDAPSTNFITSQFAKPTTSDEHADADGTRREQASHGGRHDEPVGALREQELHGRRGGTERED